MALLTMMPAIQNAGLRTRQKGLRSGPNGLGPMAAHPKGKARAAGLAASVPRASRSVVMQSVPAYYKRGL